MVKSSLLWKDDPDLNLWILLPLSLIALILLMIAVQFQDTTANAYKDMILYTLIFYAIFRSGGFATWQGLGARKNLKKNVLLGIGTFALIYSMQFVIGVPLAIGTSVVLNFFYRVISPVIIEETLVRGIVYPSAKIVTKGVVGGVLISSIFWTGFHIVALKGSVDQLVGLFVIGCIFALVDEYGKSIAPSLTGHFLWNFVKVMYGAK
jgi:membrane protease YdiL (CAAX protease family)